MAQDPYSWAAPIAKGPQEAGQEAYGQSKSTLDRIAKATGTYDPSWDEPKPSDVLDIPDDGRTLTWSDAWSGGIGDILTDFVPVVSGVKELSELKDLHSAAKRVQDDLGTEEDFALIQKYMEEAAADTTIGYKVGSILRQLPAFGMEIWLGMGAARQGAKLAAKAGMKGLSDGLEKSIREAGVRGTVRSQLKQAAALEKAGDITQAAARRQAAKNLQRELAKSGFMKSTKEAAKLGLASTAGAEALTMAAGGLSGVGWGGRSQADAYRRSFQKAGIHMEVNEAGELDLAFAETLEDFWDNLPWGIASTLTEHFTERMGGVLMGAPIMAKMQGLQAAIASKFIKTHKLLPEQFIREIQKYGWDGPIEEWMEERLGTIIRGVTFVGENEWFLQNEDGDLSVNTEALFPDWSQWVAEIVAFTVPGVAVTSLRGLFSSEDPFAGARETRAGLATETRLNRETFTRMLEREWKDEPGKLERFKDPDVSDAELMKLVEEIHGSPKLLQAAKDAGLHGFRSGIEATEPEIRAAQEWVSDPRYGDKAPNARIVDPQTAYQRYMDERLSKYVNIRFVDGGRGFNKDATATFSRRTRGGANAKPTVYINAGLREDTGYGPLFMLGKVFHEATHGYDYMDKAHMEAALDTVLEIDPRESEFAREDYLRDQVWATQPDLVGAELEKAKEKYLEEVFKPAHADRPGGWEKALESETRAYLAEDKAELLEFLLLDNGIEYIKKMKAKKPGVIDHIRDWFLEKINSIRGTNYAVGEQRMLEQLSTKLTGIDTGQKSIEIATAFKEAMDYLGGVANIDPSEIGS